MAPSSTCIWTFRIIGSSLKRMNYHTLQEHTSSRTWCRLLRKSSSSISGCSRGNDVSPSWKRNISSTLTESKNHSTCLAASTNAFHSILGMKPFKNSGLNSASRNSIWTSLNSRGKLLEVQPFTWHASRLWVIRRTIDRMNIRVNVWLSQTNTTSLAQE